MPAKNVIKEQVSESYYHVYARGVDKRRIFQDDADCAYFLRLFERYFSQTLSVSKSGVAYPNFKRRIEILAYCLMRNHLHLFIYQNEVPYLEKFMRSLMTSYSRYFNLKYDRKGHLFESRYRAVRIEDDAYLQHISRYIHLNPDLWREYKYSSIQYYKGSGGPYWLNTGRVLELFDSSEEYFEFVGDYEGHKNSLSDLKHLLAG